MTEKKVWFVGVAGNNATATESAHVTDKEHSAALTDSSANDTRDPSTALELATA